METVAYGRWIALAVEGRKTLCRCACGVERWTWTTNLRRGLSRACHACGNAERKRPLRERFEEKVNRGGPIHPVLGTRCHLWTGAADEHGYGRIGVDGGKVALATHVALQLAGFSLAPDHGALHHCDTPACVNTDDGHIYGGTQAENSRDMMRRGRGRGQFVSRP